MVNKWQCKEQVFKDILCKYPTAALSALDSHLAYAVPVTGSNPGLPACWANTTSAALDSWNVNHPSPCQKTLRPVKFIDTNLSGGLEISFVLRLFYASQASTSGEANLSCH